MGFRFFLLISKRLIMLLIFGDLMKAMWLSILGVVSIARGRIATESAFCQASGFLVQFGTETSGQKYSIISYRYLLTQCCRLLCAGYCDTQCAPSVSSFE